MSADESFQFDVFVSYSSKDGDWVLQHLVPALRAAGMRVCTDRDTFDSSTAVENIENAVSASKHTLLALSRNWMSSEWTQYESLLALHADPTGKHAKAVPLLLEREVLSKLPPRIAILSHFDFSGRRPEADELNRLVQLLRGNVLRPRAASYAAAIEDRNREALASRVEEFWIRGVLWQKLADRPQLSLGILHREGAIAQPLLQSVGTTERPADKLRPEEDILAAFRASNNSLLILGEPGGGKTTALLMLAREALSLLREDPIAPVPVVFTLSSWTGGPIETWLISELTTKYQVPAKVGEQWIETDQLLLLLDGLDELPEHQRELCLAELRAFLTRHGFAGFALCSRTTEYERLTIRLQLHSAVVLQPVTGEQLNSYLHEGGQSLAALHRVLQEDPLLNEMASSPLMLSVMTTGFRDGAADIPLHGTREERQRYVFDHYVDQAVGRRTSELPFAKDEFLRRLRWLAQRMTRRRQSVFLVEQLQLDWLSSGLGWYKTLTVLLTIILIHLPWIGLLGWTVWAAFFPEPEAKPWTFAGAMSLATLIAMYLVIWCLNLGKLANREILTVQRLHWSWRPAALWTGIVALVFIFLLSGLFGVIALAAFVSLLVTLLVAGLKVFLPSNSKFGNSLPIVTGLAAFVLGVLWFAYNFVMDVVNAGADSSTAQNAKALGAALAFFCPPTFLLSGLTGKEQETIPERPRGMVTTARNALVAGLLAAGVMGASIYLMGGQADAWGTIFLTYSLLLFASLYFGGFACVKHLALRIVLAAQRKLPWRYSKLLDGAVDRALMQRAGASYLFMHRVLQEHLAQQALPESMESPETDRWQTAYAAWSERLKSLILGGWLPDSWQQKMYYSTAIRSFTLGTWWLLGTLTVAVLYLLVLYPGNLSPEVSYLIRWSWGWVLGAMAGLVFGRWRHFAAGCVFGWTWGLVSMIFDGEAVGMFDYLTGGVLIMLFMSPIMAVGTLWTWGTLLDGLFNEER